MNAILSRREAYAFRIESEEERSLKEKHLEAVQSLAAAKLTPDDFHLRGMRLCNSQLDYYYSRFPPAVLEEIASMLAGRPVMVGHNYYTLPVGRFVSGERVFRQQDGVPREDSYWVDGLWYTPRDEQGDALVRRVDAGIYREVSIGWRCLDATCTLDREDIRTCGHVPGEIYDKGICGYEFDGITAVLEGSLVFAGGQKDTQTFVPEGSRFRDERLLPSSWTEIAEARNRDEIDGSMLPALKRVRLGFVSGAPAELADLASRAPASDPPKRTTVQSVICEKSRFKSAADAAKWVRDHDFRASKVDETNDSYRYRQFDPNSCDAKSFRTISLTQGVKAVICKKASRGAETLEELFSR